MDVDEMLYGMDSDNADSGEGQRSCAYQVHVCLHGVPAAIPGEASTSRKRRAHEVEMSPTSSDSGRRIKQQRMVRFQLPFS